MLINPWRKSLPRKTNVSLILFTKFHSKLLLFCAISMVTICAIQESHVFTCGSALFPPNSPLSETICVRESVTCSDPMELQYYSATLVHFPPVCYWCGAAEETLIHDSIFTEKERNFQTVHAICMFCRSEGKLEFTRHPLNAPKCKKT